MGKTGRTGRNQEWIPMGVLLIGWLNNLSLPRF